MGYSDAIEYGISIKYARTRKWGEWEVFREFMQNALDEEHYVKGMVPEEYLCRVEPGKTVIYDHGRGISVNNLLLGESRKEGWQRGMFGEGMKIAMIAALLLGLRVRIRSRDKEIMPIAVERVYEDTPVEVLCACIKKGLEPVEGTHVVIEGAELCDKYRRYIVQGVRSIGSDCIVLHIENPNAMYWYDVIDPLCSVDTRPSIYVRDIYVGKVETLFPSEPRALYSYNLHFVTLDESRKIPDIGSIYTDIRDLIARILNMATTDAKAMEIAERIIVDSINLCRDKWEYGLQKVINIESSTCPYTASLTDDAKKLVKEVFEKWFGVDAVVVTNMGDYLKARYLGLLPILCNEHIAYFINDIINFRKKMVEKQVGFIRKVIDIKSDMPKQEALFDVLLKMAHMIMRERFRDVKILFAILDPDIRGQASADNTILVNVVNLLEACSKSVNKCVEHWMGTIVHELAHIKCFRDLKRECEDTTREFIINITNMAGYALRIVMQYSNEYYSLLEKLIEARKAAVGG
jgi:hypothetical protein